MTEKRESWGSTFGFVLAAAGSAVGLGNLWKFPYIAWENGGGSFVLVYLGCILLVGIPILISEVTLGRYAQLSTVGAFELLSKGRFLAPLWSGVGWIGTLSGGVILSYYAVIAGWSISSLLQCLNWSFSGYVAPSDTAFGEFTANGTLQVTLALLFSILTAAIVWRGVAGGIERASRILMPSLFVLMLILVLNATQMAGFGEATSFLFSRNTITWHGVLEALGHSFFTLSLGMGAMITYGSYMDRKESILKGSFSIAILDTLIALAACIMMYTILFTFPEVQSSISSSAVGMLFIVLPKLFYTQMPFGVVLAPLFFVLLGFAALSSTISMLEVVVALLVDRLGYQRKRATLIAATAIFVLTIASALSNGSCDFFTNFNPFGGATDGFLGTLNHIVLKNKSGFLTVLDHVISNWLLPIGGLLITFFLSWVMDQKVVQDQLDLNEHRGWFRLFQFMLRYLTPLLILIVIYGVNSAG